MGTRRWVGSGGLVVLGHWSSVVDIWWLRALTSHDLRFLGSWSGCWVFHFLFLLSWFVL